jgi:putative YhdH/YhfP family quinone oxidoreductase
MRCYLVDRDASGQIHGAIAESDVPTLSDAEVTIRVEYSSLNYKDALAATGHRGVIRQLPHVPGIDAAGTVSASTSPELKPGDPVLVTGYQLGAERWGGWAEEIRVPAEWVIRLPAGFTAREAMIHGTAGFTAAQGVDILLRHNVTPAMGEIAVTGATGGVGCLAVALLAKLGFRVVAFSGKPQAKELLTRLGAAEVLPREALADDGTKPMLTARWAGAIDTIGGAPLAHLVRATHRAGCVACCGMLAGVELPLNVFPFILRGVTLAGINSADALRPKRLELWNHLATDWRLDDLGEWVHDVPLEAIGAEVERILRGEIIGRTVVRVAS